MESKRSGGAAASSSASSGGSGSSGGGSSVGVAALEGFEALVKTNSGQACVMVIQQVLSHASIFVFGELLDQPNVKDLANGPHKQHLELLRLFAYGTYADYKANPDLPKLSPKQLTKLKMLSIVEYAAKAKSLLYDDLMKILDVPNVRELEDMIIECITLGLITGKLDHRKRALEVQSVAGRDLGPNEVESMQKAFSSWLGASEALVKQLEQKATAASQNYEKRKKEGVDADNKRKQIVEDIKKEIQEGNTETLAMLLGDSGGTRGKGRHDDEGGRGMGRRRVMDRMDRGMDRPRGKMGARG